MMRLKDTNNFRFRELHKKIDQNKKTEKQKKTLHAAKMVYGGAALLLGVCAKSANDHKEHKK